MFVSFFEVFFASGFCFFLLGGLLSFRVFGVQVSDVEGWGLRRLGACVSSTWTSTTATSSAQAARRCGADATV